MNPALLPLILLGLTLVALPVVILLGRASARRALEEGRRAAARLLEEAGREAEGTRTQRLLEAREKAAAERAQAEEEVARKRAALHAEELRIEQAAHGLEQQEAEAATRHEALVRAEASVAEMGRTAKANLKAAEELLAVQNRRLEEIAALTREQARAELERRLEDEVRRSMAGFVKRATEEAEEEADRVAKTLIAQAIHRSSARTVVQGTMTPVRLPSDEIKGRIIGREGRNIRALETATGVDIIIDDTPNTLLLSSYDPLRREVARISIERLIEDGRVHPARIEEVTVKVREEVETLTAEAGEAAALEMGLAEIHPRIHKLLGRLKFRTQHGYNLLDHSLEVAHLASYMAAELGARTDVVRRAGLLHEIAQAEDVPPASPAVLASGEIASKYGETEEVVHAIRAIHKSVEPRSMEALLVSTANRIAENRPGARKHNLELFVDRLTRLETIAQSFAGVKHAYAVRAGKELRVLVQADQISDDGVTFLSRDIAARIEAEVDYPGQIRISVIRETRAIDYAV